MRLRTHVPLLVAGISLLFACGSDSRRSADSVAQASDIGTAHLTPFERKLKLMRMLPGVNSAAPAFVEEDSVDPSHAGYPAFAPNVPTVLSQGGPTVKSPQIVTITWDGDPNRDVYERFGDRIGDSTYWHATTHEYGVGKAVSGASNHVHISQQLTTISDEDLDTLIRTNVANAATSGWPAPTENTIYTVYLPPNALLFGGDNACQFGIGGYHTDSQLDGAADKPGAVINYAINLNCPAKWDVNVVTVIASHELVEASTDPFPSTKAAYVGFDADHLAFDLLQEFQDELGDACEFAKSSDYVAGSPFAFGVQRSWSNQSAKAGHNPCVPRTKLPYFNVTTFPEQMDKIQVDLTSVGGGTQATAGFKATLGTARTFDIGFYSDAPTNAAWTVWAKTPANIAGLTDNDGKPIPNGQAMATIDKPSGHNGHKAQVSVTPTQASSLGFVYVELHSVLQGAEERVYPVLVSLQ
jgi:hypothetical protein